jgi:hypothetical protein
MVSSNLEYRGCVVGAVHHTLTHIYIYIYNAVMVTHLTAIVFFYNYPEDGRITGRNMLVNRM